MVPAGGFFSFIFLFASRPSTTSPSTPSALPFIKDVSRALASKFSMTLPSPSLSPACPFLFLLRAREGESHRERRFRRKQSRVLSHLASFLTFSHSCGHLSFMEIAFKSLAGSKLIRSNFIKTTYDISLDSQISFLPLGFSPTPSLGILKV